MGRIIEILSETGCMNPVIYFDELDKISQSPKGDEITKYALSPNGYITKQGIPR